MEFPWRCNVDTIAMDLKVSWEMSDQFPRMPFHLGHHAPLPVPASSLIAEAGVVTLYMIGRTANGSRQQIADALRKTLILW